MSFNTITFAIFFAVVLVLHRLLPFRPRRVMLVVASYVFYGFGNPWYCLLLLTSTLVDFFAAQRIAAAVETGHGKRWLALSIAVNLGLLVFFKYADFGIENWNLLADTLGWGNAEQFHWMAPLGISFYTFQTMSYSIDVYQEKVKPTRDLLGFSLYVAFFPQLLAGPIERAGSLLPQLQRELDITRADREIGFQRALWGLFKKVVIADRLGLFVDQIFVDPGQAGSPALILATAAFGLQIYMDFSGYTDIAIGLARMIGIRLRENFNWPTLARNPVDFWNRWHISLSHWFRDYLFTAIMGRRRPGPLRKLLNLVTVLSLMGLWHGATWMFVLLGLFAGMGIAFYEGSFIVTRRPRNRPWFGRSRWSDPAAVVLNSLYLGGLILLFRCTSMDHLGQVLGGIVGGKMSFGPQLYLLAGMIALIGLGVIATRLKLRGREDVSMPAPVRAVLWCLLTLGILYGAVDTTEQFIYFQF